MRIIDISRRRRKSSTSFNYEDNGIAYYKLDEQNSTHALDYINNNDGVITGAITQGAAGKINTAYLIDGSGKYVTLPRLLPLDNSDFAFSFIVKGDESLGGVITQYLNAGDPNRFGIRFRNNKLAYWKAAYLYTSTAIITDGEFHIVQVSRKNEIVSIYIDGNLDGSFTDATGFQDTPTMIGSFVGTTVIEFLDNTIIDEVYFHNTYFGLQDIVNIYNNNNYSPLTVEIKPVLELGQSNMEGRDGDTANLNYPFTSNNGYFYNGALKDSITTLRGDAQDGSYANYFAEKFKELTNNKALMLEEGSGGSGLTPTSQASNNWSSSGNLRSDAINKSDNYKTYSGQDISYILWCQGERDAQEMDNNGSYTKAIVKAAMQDIIDWAQTNFPGIPFLISETGDLDPATNTQGWQDMRAVQNEIANENFNVYIAFNNAKDFTSEGKMSDTVHYNFVGYKEMGEAYAIYINDNL